MFTAPFQLTSRGGVQLPCVVRGQIIVTSDSSDFDPVAAQAEAEKVVDENSGSIRQFYLAQHQNADLSGLEVTSKMTSMRGMSALYENLHGVEVMTLNVYATARNSQEEPEEEVILPPPREFIAVEFFDGAT